MNAGSRAIREIDPDILVAVHNTEPQDGYQWIAQDYNTYGVDYEDLLHLIIQTFMAQWKT